MWPVLTDELARRAIPHVVVNGRMSERPYRQWRFIGGGTASVFGKIGLVLAQTDADAARFIALGVPEGKCMGNLRSSMCYLRHAGEERRSGRAQDHAGRTGGWLAASTIPARRRSWLPPIRGSPPVMIAC